MSPAKRISTTKKEIIQVATRMFLEKGFTDTSVKSICEQLGISTGNLTFHYPTKEHLLAVLVEMLCDFQWAMMERAASEGQRPLIASSLELPAMAAVCEENPIAKDFYLSAYSYDMTLDIIRKNDTRRSQRVFAELCPDWTEKDFAAAQDLVAGIEYATLKTTSTSPALDQRVANALDAIGLIYRAPKEDREMRIHNVLQMDYRALGRRILREFIDYVHEISEEDLEALLQRSEEGKQQ